jgi:hypothetical protein
VGELENVVRDFFRHVGAATGLHPSVADQVADAIVGPQDTEEKVSNDATA